MSDKSAARADENDMVKGVVENAHENSHSPADACVDRFCRRRVYARLHALDRKVFRGMGRRNFGRPFPY